MQFTQALQLLQTTAPLISHTEILPLLDAQDRILAQDIFATKPLPCFDNSAMDGYVLNTKDAGKVLRIKTTILAGDCLEVSLNAGECAKIMTGAKIPQNANCVVPFELIEGGLNNSVQITAPADLKEYANIRQSGEEVQQDSLLIPSKTRLNADVLTLLATQGISHIAVFKPLNITIFTSGDELKEPWQSANTYQIYNSNATMTQAVLKSYGFSAQYGGILKDDFDTIANALETPSDVIFTTGGASKGEADFIRQVLEKNGATLLINGVDIKPGKPIMIAKYKQKYIIALPGNPLASNVLLRALIIPFLLRLSSASAHYPSYIYLKAKEDLKRKARVEILLARIEGAFVSFTKGGKYGSGEVTPMAQSNALVLLDSSYTHIKAGDLLKVLPFQTDFSTQAQDCFNTL